MQAWSAPAAARDGSAVGRWLAAGLLLLATLVLTGCATPGFTRDDGRAVDEKLLAQIRDYGAGERMLRPAIVRSAELRDTECDKQWELPFSVASAADWSADERVAWVRALDVDERLTVVAAVAASPLQAGERIVAVGKLRREHDAALLLQTLAQMRDLGEPFMVTTALGRTVKVQPFEVCRGYVRLAPPNTPQLQDYHWLLTLHPLELVRGPLTEDEALWVVLWTQGLSEEGGLRMKAFHYTVSIGTTLYNLATLASGLKGAALAAEAAVKTAQTVAAQVATELLKQQLIDQARAYAIDLLRDAANDASEKLLRMRMATAMQQAVINRGRLGGVSRVAATVFDQADAWARRRMGLLNANPLAGVALHQRLAETSRASNAFVFDSERMAALEQQFAADGLEVAMLALLKGLRPDSLGAELGAMPLASGDAGFSYHDSPTVADGPYAYGLVAALMDMPVSSKEKP